MGMMMARSRRKQRLAAVEAEKKAQTPVDPDSEAENARLEAEKAAAAAKKAEEAERKKAEAEAKKAAAAAKKAEKEKAKT